MNYLQRPLAYMAALVLCGAALAQPTPPYPVYLNGQVLGCQPNSTVMIEISEPIEQFTVPLDSNCMFSTVIDAWVLDPNILVYTNCNGPNWADTLYLNIDPLFPDSTLASVLLNCGGGNTSDCEGILGGPAQPGTPCTVAPGVPGTWSAGCDCEPNASDCQPCFTISQATTTGGISIPFTAQFTNCSAGSSPLNYSWSFDGGMTFTNNVTDTSMIFVAGTYQVCLVVSNFACTVMTCDSMVVDENGVINPANNQPCSAGFWVIQAYQNVDSTGGNPGGVEPIPNEVWIWNLSSGSGNYQFVWDFGDGSTSTEAFPTHIYSSGGPYVLCLTMTDDAGCTAIYCDSLSVDADGLLNGMVPGGSDDRAGFTVNVIQELPTNVDEIETLDDVALWPNPVPEAITLTLQSSKNSKLDLSILDLNGRLISATNYAINTGNNRVILPVNELESGMYIIRISDGTTTVSRRFVKQ